MPRPLIPALPAILALLAGCATTPSVAPNETSTSEPTSGTIETETHLITAELTRIDETDTFLTAITIDRFNPTGLNESVAAPHVLSRAGQTAVVTIGEDTTGDRVEVEILVAEDEATSADIAVRIIEGGELVAAPTMRLAVP
jgi:hypothetical protein